MRSRDSGWVRVRTLLTLASVKPGAAVECRFGSQVFCGDKPAIVHGSERPVGQGKRVLGHP